MPFFTWNLNKIGKKIAQMCSPSSLLFAPLFMSIPYPQFEKALEMKFWMIRSTSQFLQALLTEFMLTWIKEATFCPMNNEAILSGVVLCSRDWMCPNRRGPACCRIVKKAHAGSGTLERPDQKCSAIHLRVLSHAKFTTIVEVTTIWGLLHTLLSNECKTTHHHHNSPKSNHEFVTYFQRL